jgi:hypothetical protein
MSSANFNRFETSFYIYTQKYNLARGNTSTRTIGYQRSRSVAKSSTTSLSNPQAKQHTFGKRDRTTSLMALQALAEKIAMCM